ncbi:hypothetical protein HanXRQr2_Chr12g0532821 [Helianthus annuus]|uniref:Uncharacterized protein n=1 Tax=Helianthus annuus TaxID=4232 RepID=A0A9K3HF66_HELAN|nr:hypothetical protein HanXRQr2_Chr12g0532821 [Helianthus annuus]
MLNHDLNMNAHVGRLSSPYHGYHHHPRRTITTVIWPIYTNFRVVDPMRKSKGTYNHKSCIRFKRSHRSSKRQWMRQWLL